MFVLPDNATSGKCCICEKDASDTRIEGFGTKLFIPIKYVLCEDCGGKEAEVCRFCENGSKNRDFVDFKSLKENRESKSCQKCQDELFNKCTMCHCVVLLEEEINSMECSHCGKAICRECKNRKINCCEESEVERKSEEEEEESSVLSSLGKNSITVHICVYCEMRANQKCRGCGAFYCSHECQIKDWKRGDHKKKCGRKRKI